MYENLTDEQRRKIRELFNEWDEEIDLIERPNLRGGLSHASNKPYIDLQKKYAKLIDAVIENKY